jgi:DNA replication protein DnaC
LKQVNYYAFYILTAFCPWDLKTQIPKFGTDFKGLSNFMKKLNGEEGSRKPTFLERSRDKLIQQVTKNLSINRKNKKMMVLWRNQDRKLWNGKPDWSGDFMQIMKTEPIPQFSNQQKEEEQATKDITNLQNMTNMDESLAIAKHAKNEIAKANYITNSLTTLSELFDNNFTKDGGSLRQDFWKSHVQVSCTNNLHTVRQIREAIKKNAIESPIIEKEAKSNAGRTSYDVLKNRNSFNKEQLKFLDKMGSTITNGTPHQELFLLYGGPGVGKTHTIIGLQQLTESLGDGVVACAPTGSAASNVPHAQTIHSLFGLRVKPPEITTDKFLPPMTPMKLAATRIFFKNKNNFLVDEASMLGPIGLALIHQRLQEVKGNTFFPSIKYS